MKNMGDMLLRRDPFSEIVMGNTAIVRAMVEAGTRVVTSYPGSPTPEIASAIQSIPKDDRPFYFEFSTNEKGGHGTGLRGGGQRPLVHGVFQERRTQCGGGYLRAVEPDEHHRRHGHRAWETIPGPTPPRTSRTTATMPMMSYTPVLEPADPAEVYRFYLEAARLSRQHQHAGDPAADHPCVPRQSSGWPSAPGNPNQPDETPRFDPANGPYIPITHVWPSIKNAPPWRRLEQVRQHAEKTELNRVVDAGNPARGVITMGLPFLSLMEALERRSRTNRTS
jgi:indolepyruvate ferredoxin oxidoreductase alpha subunit